MFYARFSLEALTGCVAEVDGMDGSIGGASLLSLKSLSKIHSSGGA
jgi:hypothetical protein